MNEPNFLLIAAAEVAFLLLALCIFLFIKNRSLSKLVSQLRDKAKSLMLELKRIKAEGQSGASGDEEHASYIEFIEQELEKTLAHHDSLDSDQDISLDISPETDLPKRTAALRHALLLAEKEGFSKIEHKKGPNWTHLRLRYEQLFSYYEDFNNDDELIDSTELDTLKSELENAKNRVKNLEKFKSLYFDLEEKWKDSKTAAQAHYEDLSNMASQLETTQEFDQALENYHASYNGFSEAMDKGPDGAVIAASTGNFDPRNSHELQQLRTVAADQHKIIEGLQRKLRDAASDQEKREVVESLQDELQKQMRFVQESETCIQLLEDELNTANQDLEQLKARLGKLPEIKQDLIDIRNQYDELEIKFHSTQSENRKLQKMLKQKSASPAGASAEEMKLRKELSEMSSRYNELEEKFLDLKLQQ